MYTPFFVVVALVVFFLLTPPWPVDSLPHHGRQTVYSLCWSFSTSVSFSLRGEVVFLCYGRLLPSASDPTEFLLLYMTCCWLTSVNFAEDFTLTDLRSSILPSDQHDATGVLSLWLEWCWLVSSLAAPVPALSAVPLSARVVIAVVSCVKRRCTECTSWWLGFPSFEHFSCRRFSRPSLCELRTPCSFGVSSSSYLTFWTARSWDQTTSELSSEDRACLD